MTFYALIYDIRVIVLCLPDVLTHCELMNADKMLKERFLNRDEEVIEEEFTDDEESEDELDGTGKFSVAVFRSRYLHTPLRELTWHTSTSMQNFQSNMMAMTTKNESRIVSLSIFPRELDGTESWKSSLVTASFRGRV